MKVPVNNCLLSLTIRKNYGCHLIHLEIFMIHMCCVPTIPNKVFRYKERKLLTEQLLKLEEIEAEVSKVKLSKKKA